MSQILYERPQMATQATTVAGFQLLLAECADYLAADDFTNARKKYLQAEVVNAALELDINSQGTSVRRRESLNAVLKALNAVEGATLRVGDNKRTIKTRTGYKT